MGGLTKRLEDAVKGIALAAILGTSMSASEAPAFAQQKQAQKQEQKKLQQAPKDNEPDEQTQKFKEAQIKSTQLFVEDYKKIDDFNKSSKPKITLAEKIVIAGSLAGKLAQNAENPNNDKALNFSLRHEAMRMSAEALDLQKAYGLAERLSEDYSTSDLRLKCESFNLARKVVKYAEQAKLLKDAEQATSVAESGYELTGELYIKGDLTSALKIVADGKTLPKLSKDAAQKLTDLETEIKQVDAAEKTLSAMPDDVKANTTIARYTAFRRGKLDEAKEYAKKGKDQVLIDLIDADSTNPDTPDSQFLLGKQYFEASKNMKGFEKDQLAMRAAFYLSSAKPKANAIMQGDIDKILKEMGPGSKVTPESLKEGLVGLWLFDEGSGASAQDSSNKRNNGKLMNGPKWVQGNSGTALSFDGIDDYVSLAIDGMPAANAPQTISWYNFVAKTPNNAQGIISLGDGDSVVQPGYLNGKLAVWKHGGTVLVSTDPPQPNTWHHCAYTFDGKNHKLYVDGMLKNTSVVEPQTAVPKKLELGRWIGGSAYFAGNMDEVRIYKRALKDEEIQALSQKKK
jgi:hypothetical protein